MATEVPIKTEIINSGDGLRAYSPYAFCLEAQGGNVTFTALKESTPDEVNVDAQALPATLYQDKRLYGQYTQVQVATGSLIVYIKKKV